MHVTLPPRVEPSCVQVKPFVALNDRNLVPAGRMSRTLMPVTSWGPTLSTMIV